MKSAKYILGWIFLALWGTTYVQAQEADMSDDGAKPVRDMFDGIWIIDNQTVFVPIKGTFEFDIQHRFGIVKNGYRDLYGLNAPGNIRLGFEYVPIENLMVGFGLTKANLTWDLHGKYAILRQNRSGSIPVSLSYYLNAAIDSRDKKNFTDPDIVELADRVSYFHQLLVARKLSNAFTVQVAGSVSHFNTVDAIKGEGDEVVQKWKNDHIAVAVSARYQATPSMNIMVNYDQPVTTHEFFDPQPNLSFGVEFTTSSHQFQIFAGNFYNITPQRNNVFNNNRIGDGEFLIGFNITRLWNL